MRDIGDVFRTLGEMELAQDMNKSIIATTSAQVKRGAHRERMTTPGDIQAWPTTPLTSGSRQRNVDNSPIDGVNKQVKTVKSERVRKSKNVPGQDDEHVKNSASAASMQRFGYDIHEWMTGNCFHSEFIFDLKKVLFLILLSSVYNLFRHLFLLQRCRL